MDKKSNCLGMSDYEELLEEVHYLCLTEDFIGECLIESGFFLGFVSVELHKCSDGNLDLIMRIPYKNDRHPC